MIRRMLLTLGVAAALIGGIAAHTPAADAQQAIVQPSHQGGCHDVPAGATCLEFVDGYVWVVEDTITGWGMNHGTVQMAYGLTANYAHALGTDKVWVLEK